MKTSIQNIVRSSYFIGFIGAVLGGSIPIIQQIWLSPYLPFFQVDSFLISLAGPFLFLAASEIVEYGSLVPLILIGWLIFKQLGFAQPALSAAAVLIGIQAIVRLLATELPSSIVGEVVKQGIWPTALIYAIAGLLFAPLAIKLVARIQNKTHLRIAVALLIIAPVAIAVLWQLKFLFTRGY